MNNLEMITIPRVAYESLLQELEDARDLALIAERRHEPTMSIERVERSMAGESLVKLWREEKGVKQSELAAAVGIARSTMNEIESGKKTPGLRIALKIAGQFGLTVDDLFDD